MRLDISELSVIYSSGGRPLTAVDGVTLSIPTGESACLIGESGSGKTTLALAVARLLPEGAAVSGDVRFGDRPLLSATDREMREILRREIGFVFQDPVGSLVPNRSIGSVLIEVVAFRRGVSRAEAKERILDLVEMVGLPDPERTLRALPRELSGGMCQRIAIALAMAGSPNLLIADEAVSALDCVSQLGILDLLFSLQRTQSFAMLYVTHDLRVARRFDWVGVLRHGRLVEWTAADRFFVEPGSEYGAQLLAAAEKLSVRTP